MEKELYNAYIRILNEELVPAMGCTEPIAVAAAASDARMSGCELPVVINSGSGNQGITASVPVIIYAKELGVSEELLYRALAVSNLVTLHLKSCRSAKRLLWRGCRYRQQGRGKHHRQCQSSGKRGYA